jgi:hypothetical protein
VPSFQDQKQKALGIISRLESFDASGSDEEVSRLVADAADRLESGKLYVAAVGEFKRGKSTLLGALLEEPDLFPENPDIATNLVSTVTYGDNERVCVYVGEPGSERVESLTRAEIRDFVTEQGNRRNKRRARLLEIETPNSKLAEGIVLVDTPGVGGVNTEHTEVTYRFVTSANVVLFVLDALTPLSARELDFLELVAEHCEALIFVVTKKDKVADYQRIVDNTRHKLSEVLGERGRDAPIVPVSSTAKLKYLRSGDSRDLEVSNFPALETELWTLLGEHGGAILLLSVLGKIARAVDLQVAPLRSEAQAYEQRSHAERVRASSEIAAAGEQVKKLKSQKADWRVELRRGLEDIRRAAGRRLLEGFLHLDGIREHLLADERLLESPMEIGSKMEAEVALLESRLEKQLRSDTDAAIERTEAATGLVLSPVAVADPERCGDDRVSPSYSQPAAPAPRSRRKVTGARLLDVARVASGSGTTPGTIGAMIGMLFGPVGLVVGGTIGWLAGMTQGARARLEELQERDSHGRRQEIDKHLKAFLNDRQYRMKSELDERLVRFERDAIDEFDRVIREEAVRIDRTRTAIQEAGKRSEEEAERRAAELKQPLIELERLRNRIGALARELALSRDYSAATAPVPLHSAASVGPDSGARAGAPLT